MTILYNSTGVRELDRVAIEEEGIPGITLMKRAAAACADTLLARWPAPAKVAVLCGSGNNAGDGYIVAGLLAARGHRVSVAMIGRSPAEGTDAAAALEFCRQNQVPFADLDECLSEASHVVDALLGTGLTGTVRENYARVIEAVNSSDLPVLSVDIPSGICADTGSVLGSAVRASVTVTFIGRKIGLLTNDGVEYCGELVFDDLEVPAGVYEQVPGSARLLQYAELIPLLQPRHRNAHKVSHGHVMIVAGGRGMAGAAAMAAEASLYSGAGMVTVATHPENVGTVTTRRPEVMARGITEPEALEPLLARATTVILGPGIGQDAWAKALFDYILSSDAASDLPKILDADGLNLLALEPRASSNWVLTPHPGEAARLLGQPVQADRVAAVRQLQENYGGVVLLKGAGTLIASENDLDLCPYGNPGMSVAGMGDLLAGTIGGLAAQGLSLRDAACLGAVVHSLAADKLVESQGERGMLATDLLPVIRQLVNS